MYKYCISILLDLFLSTVTFEMPVAVLLLQWIGVGDCGYPISYNVSIMILASFAFKNSAPSYASAANAATNLSIWNSENITPFKWMG